MYLFFRVRFLRTTMDDGTKKRPISKVSIVSQFIFYICVNILTRFLNRMKKWGMDSYVYAPKDDYKHRAYWRELYTVEEAEHLTGLINAAKAKDVTFYYALSPGLDITYSNQKEINTLKRKLEQVHINNALVMIFLFFVNIY